MEALCDGCGTAIPPASAATPVPFSTNRRSRKWTPDSSRAWLCTSCSALPSSVTRRSAIRDGHYTPPGAVESPAPCEGCGRIVALPVSARRKRVTCSRACLVRVSPSHRARSTASAAVTACKGCDGPMPGGRADRCYCSAPCRQRAYRRRTPLPQP